MIATLGMDNNDGVYGVFGILGMVVSCIGGVYLGLLDRS